MLEPNAMTVTIIYLSAFAILLVGFLTAISSKDLIRLLIALELMFGAVFMSLIPVFVLAANPAFGTSIIAIFTSAGELLVLIAAVIIRDRRNKNVLIEQITIGGDRV